MKKLIIFDLDGTLLDTSNGIIHCYRKTGEMLGLGSVRVKDEMCVIGGPLAKGFETLYGTMSADTLTAAVNTYKKLYGEEGIKIFKPYRGIEETLKSLKSSGFFLAVATLKLQKYAEFILKSADIAKYFDVILGWDGENDCSKSATVTAALHTLGCTPNDAVLVGDSEYDEMGAKEAGVDFVGVSYGFGITESASEKKNYPTASSPYEIYSIIVRRAAAQL